MNMKQSPRQAASPLFWVPSRSVLVWGAINVLSFLLTFYWLQGLLWVYGERFFVPLYPVPSNDILLTHGEEFKRIQLLFAWIPSMICVVVIAGAAIWRHKLAFSLGSIAGLLLRDVLTYIMELHNQFHLQGLNAYAHVVLGYVAHIHG